MKHLGISNNKQLALLLDPDKKDMYSDAFFKKINTSKISLVFVGGSHILHNVLETFVKYIKQFVSKPIILFPGSSDQITSEADGILFLSLLSGRNPEYLIGQQVKAAMTLKRSKLDVIPTGYILIDGGVKSSVEYISNTQPIPADKINIVISTAVAGELSGKKLIYIDAGSGALNPISSELISAVSNQINIPLIVGGGVKTTEDIQKAWDAGADIVVVGNAFEKNPRLIDYI
jgi:phosphoglycerol geranylgeranyltransferase